MWSTPRHGHRERLVQGEGVRVSEVEPMQPFGDDDRVAAVGGEVHVVGVVDRDRCSRLARARIDRREAVAEVVRHVQRLQVPAGHDVLGERTDVEVLDHAVGAGVDHVDRCALAVRDVDQGSREASCACEHVRAVVGVDVAAYDPDGAPRRGCDTGRHARELAQRRLGAAGPRPPASTIRSPRLTAARSDRGAFRWPASRTRWRAGSMATIRAVGVFVFVPRPPTR